MGQAPFGLSTYHVSVHFILMRPLGIEFYYYPHFTVRNLRFTQAALPRAQILASVLNSQWLRILSAASLIIATKTQLAQALKFIKHGCESLCHHLLALCSQASISPSLRFRFLIQKSRYNTYLAVRIKRTKTRTSLSYTTCHKLLLSTATEMHTILLDRHSVHFLTLPECRNQIIHCGS